ncbi:MAG: signal peptidase II [Verrucomicrobiales bacterium]|nr:signal peptidase II [Verrucomicrobiales bacterium]
MNCHSTAELARRGRLLHWKDIKWTPEARIAATAVGLLVLDQVTKWMVIHRLPLGREIPVLPGFFRLVHWGNTGAAWSLFHGSNHALAAISVAALVVLFLARRYFEGDTIPGQFALGLIFGGIVGNLTDRLVHHHVVDFLYFHLIRRDGVEMGFPAFNVADMAICTGVGIVFLLSWRSQPGNPAPGIATLASGGSTAPGPSGAGEPSTRSSQ